MLGSLLISSAAQATPHAGQSQNVGVIGGFFSINGGGFPTSTSGPTGSFTDFTFTEISPATVSAATLAPFDTILLNVAGPTMSCNVNTLSASQKTALSNALQSGKKLIIYDSECQPQNYSWLPFAFTTSNPGALGGTGTVHIVENNLLGTDQNADPHFINAGILGSQTDAVGDMNVLTTQDPNICLHMSGTNALGQTGPTHVYYQKGGILIYTGFDIDFLSPSSSPNSATPDGNLAKIWLQELQQPLNGQGLACSQAVVGISLTQTTNTNPVGTQHTVTAAVTDQSGNAQSNVLVSFTVTGANNGAPGGTCNPANCRTDSNGQVTFTYTGNNAGDDNITACFTNQAGQQVCSRTLKKTWTQSNPSGGKVSARGTVKDDLNRTVTFSAANDCNAAASTRPFIVQWPGNRFTKTTVTSSTCSNDPSVGYTGPAGFNTQVGEAQGTLQSGGTGTITWKFVDGAAGGSPADKVQFTVKNSGGTTILNVPTQSSGALNGTPGGVWTFGP